MIKFASRGMEGLGIFAHGVESRDGAVASMNSCIGPVRLFGVGPTTISKSGCAVLDSAASLVYQRPHTEVWRPWISFVLP